MAGSGVEEWSATSAYDENDVVYDPVTFNIFAARNAITAITSPPTQLPLRRAETVSNNNVHSVLFTFETAQTPAMGVTYTFRYELPRGTTRTVTFSGDDVANNPGNRTWIVPISDLTGTTGIPSNALFQLVVVDLVSGAGTTLNIRPELDNGTSGNWQELSHNQVGGAFRYDKAVNDYLRWYEGTVLYEGNVLPGNNLHEITSSNVTVGTDDITFTGVNGTFLSSLRAGGRILLDLEDSPSNLMLEVASTTGTTLVTRPIALWTDSFVISITDQLQAFLRSTGFGVGRALLARVSRTEVDTGTTPTPPAQRSNAIRFGTSLPSAVDSHIGDIFHLNSTDVRQQGFYQFELSGWQFLHSKFDELIVERDLTAPGNNAFPSRGNRATMEALPQEFRNDATTVGDMLRNYDYTESEITRLEDQFGHDTITLEELTVEPDTEYRYNRTYEVRGNTTDIFPHARRGAFEAPVTPTSGADAGTTNNSASTFGTSLTPLVAGAFPDGPLRGREGINHTFRANVYQPVVGTATRLSGIVPQEIGLNNAIDSAAEFLPAGTFVASGGALDDGGPQINNLRAIYRFGADNSELIDHDATSGTLGTVSDGLIIGQTFRPLDEPPGFNGFYPIWTLDFGATNISHVRNVGVWLEESGDLNSPVSIPGVNSAIYGEDEQGNTQLDVYISPTVVGTGQTIQITATSERQRRFVLPIQGIERVTRVEIGNTDVGFSNNNGSQTVYIDGSTVRVGTVVTFTYDVASVYPMPSHSSFAEYTLNTPNGNIVFRTVNTEGLHVTTSISSTGDIIWHIPTGTTNRTGGLINSTTVPANQGGIWLSGVTMSHVGYENFRLRVKAGTGTHSVLDDAGGTPLDLDPENTYSLVSHLYLDGSNNNRIRIDNTIMQWNSTTSSWDHLATRTPNPALEVVGYSITDSTTDETQRLFMAQPVVRFGDAEYALSQNVTRGHFSGKFFVAKVESSATVDSAFRQRLASSTAPFRGLIIRDNGIETANLPYADLSVTYDGNGSFVYEQSSVVHGTYSRDDLPADGSWQLVSPANQQEGRFFQTGAEGSFTAVNGTFPTRGNQTSTNVNPWIVLQANPDTTLTALPSEGFIVDTVSAQIPSGPIDRLRIYNPLETDLLVLDRTFTFSNNSLQEDQSNWRETQIDPVSLGTAAVTTPTTVRLWAVEDDALRNTAYNVGADPGMGALPDIYVPQFRDDWRIANSLQPLSHNDFSPGTHYFHIRYRAGRDRNIYYSVQDFDRTTGLVSGLARVASPSGTLAVSDDYRTGLGTEPAFTMAMAGDTDQNILLQQFSTAQLVVPAPADPLQNGDFRGSAMPFGMFGLIELFMGIMTVGTESDATAENYYVNYERRGNDYYWYPNRESGVPNVPNGVWQNYIGDADPTTGQWRVPLQG